MSFSIKKMKMSFTIEGGLCLSSWNQFSAGQHLMQLEEEVEGAMSEVQEEVEVEEKEEKPTQEKVEIENQEVPEVKVKAKKESQQKYVKQEKK